MSEPEIIIIPTAVFPSLKILGGRAIIAPNIMPRNSVCYLKGEQGLCKQIVLLTEVIFSSRTSKNLRAFTYEGDIEEVDIIEALVLSENFSYDEAIKIAKEMEE